MGHLALTKSMSPPLLGHGSPSIDKVNVSSTGRERSPTIDKVNISYPNKV